MEVIRPAVHPIVPHAGIIAAVWTGSRGGGAFQILRWMTAS